MTIPSSTDRGVPVHIYDNTAAVDGGCKPVSVIGSIRNIVKGKSLEVNFEGTSQFIHVFARQAEKYLKIGTNGELPAGAHG